MGTALLKLRRKWRSELRSSMIFARSNSSNMQAIELESINQGVHLITPDRRKKSMKSSIWIKLTVFIGILVVLSSGVLAAVLWLKTREQLRDEIERRLVAVSILRKDAIDDYFMGEIDKMVLISSRIQIINYLTRRGGVSKATAEYDLHSALSAITEITSAAIYDANGTLEFATGDGIFSQKFPLDKLHRHNIPVQIDLPSFTNGTWEYNMSKAMLMNQTRIGVLAAWINATTLANLIYDRTGLQKTGELLVGVPKDEKTFQLVMPPRLDANVTTIPRKGAMLAAIEQKTGVLRERDYRGVKVICAYTPMAYSKWGLLAKLSIDEAYAPVDNIKVVIIIMIVITLILGIMASLCVAKIFTAPIMELGKVAAALGQGDMGARVAIRSVWFRDEIHELQVTFNSMADQIGDHHATLEQKVSERTRDLARANEVLASQIEERKRIEVELQKAKDAAVAADRAKSEFLANMSHEIRTPLNGIINCTELCLDTHISMDQQEYLELVRFSARHLLRIITDILDFSKIEAGKLEMEEIQFSLYDQLEHAVSVLAARAHKKGLEIAWKVDSDVPHQLIGDPGRLFQIFVNLIGNSIKFTDEGEVVVSAHVHNRQQDKVELLFYVKDTGVGIPKSKQCLLFQAFSQVDSSTTRLYGGTGLGLVISSKLATAMGGKMWVESEGRGSTFYFTAWFDIPPVCVLPSSSNSKIDNLKGVSVLVVDDNKTSLGILVDILKAWGMLVEAATNVEDAKVALERAARSGRPFKVLMLDLWLNKSRASDLVYFVRGRPGLIGRTASLETKFLKNNIETIANMGFDNKVFEEVDPEFPMSILRQQNGLLTASKLSTDVTIQTGVDFLDGRSNVSEMEVLSIVMLTSIDHSDAARCKNLGVEIYTSKPVKLALLGRALRAAIGVAEEKETVVQPTQPGNMTLESVQRKARILHILVAEDNVVNQRVAVSLLKKWGHTAVLACNGAEAVEKASEEAFDLILMDVQMPICDGFQATTRIRESEKNRGIENAPPIVAMTAHAMNGDGDRCIAAGMDGYISKPLNAKKLQELLQNIVRR